MMVSATDYFESAGFPVTAKSFHCDITGVILPMSINHLLTAESVSLTLQALLTTHDQNTRAEANRWLVETFRPSFEAWDICLRLLDASSSLPSDIQVFAGQTLLSKLNDNIDQIFNDESRCLQLCRFLTTQCLLLPQQQHHQLSKPVRLTLSECLGLAVVSFLGAHWSTALVDVLNAARLDPAVPPSSGQLIGSINLLHMIGILPELVTAMEHKKTLMYLLGHRQYTSWRKTAAAKKLKNANALIADTIASILDNALSIIQLETETGSLGVNNNLAVDVIHEGLIAAKNWSKDFDTPLLVASTLFSDVRFLWRLLNVYGCSDDPALPEMFGATIPSLQLAVAQMSSNGIIPTHATLQQQQQQPFALENLGPARGVVEPLLVFFFQKLLTPLSVVCEGDTLPSLERIDSFGGRKFLMFAYHWTSIVYDLSVVSPSLLLRQSSPISSQLIPNTPISIPSNFLFQLLRLSSLLHPLTHARVLEMWNEVTDLKNDRLLTHEDINRLLSELSQVTMKCLLTHLRRDSPTWNPKNSSDCSDASGKTAYVETSLDAIVHLYYLYEGIHVDHSIAFLQQLTQTLIQYCDQHDDTGVAACLILLGSIVETVIDLTSPHFTRDLIAVCQRVPLDNDCVDIVANLIKTQSVFLTKESHTTLWTAMFECLMRVFKCSPRLCAEGIFELCDSGGNLGLQQVPKPTDVIRNFYLFVDSTAKSMPDLAIEFEPPLYGALAALVRQLRSKDANQVFADSLAETVSALQSQFGFSEAVNVTEWEDQSPPRSIQNSMRLLRRLSRAISSLESKQAEISDVNMPEIRQSFMTTLLFGNNSSNNQEQNQSWKTCCIAASALLSIRVTSKHNGLAILASDCYERRKLENKLWTRIATSQSAKNLGLHLIRQTIRSTMINEHPEYWEFIVNLFLHHLKSDNGPKETDFSICYALSDILRLISHYRCEVIGDSPTNRALATDLAIVQQLHTITIPFLLQKAAAKADLFPVSCWGHVIKSFFDAAKHIVLFWDVFQLDDEHNCALLAQILVRALECPNKKVQKNVFVTVSRLMSSKTPALRVPTMKFYPEMVKSFWCFCQLWELPNMTAIVNLAEALIRPANNNEDEFVEQSQIVIAAARGKIDGLMLVLSEDNCAFVLKLIRVLRGMRLRQLLMDLVKIGKRVQSPDSLISYEFALNDIPPKRRPVAEYIDIDD